MRRLAHLLQDELLVLRGRILAELHDESICSCLHSDAGLWLVGVIANFVLGRVLKKLKTEQSTGVSYPLTWKGELLDEKQGSRESMGVGAPRSPLTR